MYMIADHDYDYIWFHEYVEYSSCLNLNQGGGKKTGFHRNFSGRRGGGKKVTKSIFGENKTAHQAQKCKNWGTTSTYWGGVVRQRGNYCHEYRFLQRPSAFLWTRVMQISVITLDWKSKQNDLVVSVAPTSEKHFNEQATETCQRQAFIYTYNGSWCQRCIPVSLNEIWWHFIRIVGPPHNFQYKYMTSHLMATTFES